MLFFGSHCERLCMMQFSLISLIPGLIRHLQDCADPKFNSYEESLVMPTSLRTSERASRKEIMLSQVNSCWQFRSACVYGTAVTDLWEWKLVRSIYPIATAWYARRSWNQILYCWIDQFFAFTAERPIQRYIDQRKFFHVAINLSDDSWDFKFCLL